MKKLMLVVLALVGAGAAYKVISDQRAKASLWAEITDRIPNA
ncbi:MAG: DLW-39 family protein [Propionibacteriaceae bacterium]|nr:DLW-39 family protein [Propionibacteriaceae bacterium]